MALPDKTDLFQRVDAVAQLLDSALAFSRVVADLREDDTEATRLADEARAATVDLQEARQAMKIFAGRKAVRQVREAEIACNELLGRLADLDHELAPSSLRIFLQQQPAADAHLLADLLGFYLHLDSGSEWNSQRIYKVDLLLTRLSQRLKDPQAEPGAERLSQILAASRPAAQAPLTDLERTTFKRNLETIESEVEAADSLGYLIESGTLKRYRHIKHRLGRLLLHPDLLPVIVETNCGLQRKIRRLNSRTLTGIFSLYQGIFEGGFKGGVDPGLRNEIDQLNVDFDRFEHRVKQDEVRLTELEEVLATLTSFSARLDEATKEAPPPPAPPKQKATLPEESSEQWLEEEVLALLDLLAENNRKGWPPELVSFSPQEGFEIYPREIVAFRRLTDQADVDRPLETFLLKAAALRRSIKKSARKLAAVGDSEIYRQLPVFALAQQAVKVAESFLARYSNAVEQAILDSDVAEAQRLQILRMRLVRESAGIWLQVYQQS